LREKLFTTKAVELRNSADVDVKEKCGESLIKKLLLEGIRRQFADIASSSRTELDSFKIHSLPQSLLSSRRRKRLWFVVVKQASKQA